MPVVLARAGISIAHGAQLAEAFPGFEGGRNYWLFYFYFLRLFDLFRLTCSTCWDPSLSPDGPKEERKGDGSLVR